MLFNITELTYIVLLTIAGYHFSQCVVVTISQKEIMGSRLTSKTLTQKICDNFARLLMIMPPIRNETFCFMNLLT